MKHPIAFSFSDVKKKISFLHFNYSNLSLWNLFNFYLFLFLNKAECWCYNCDSYVINESLGYLAKRFGTLKHGKLEDY
jgi:hypothetical protein